MEHKIALFVDADNLPPKYGKQMMEKLTARGDVFIRRIYGNWQKGMHAWDDFVSAYGLMALQQMIIASGKNASDMTIAVDAMDIMADGLADTFAIASDDSDFTPLAIRLREHGRRVIGLGTDKTTKSFRNACHEFIVLTEEPKPPQLPPTPTFQATQLEKWRSGWLNTAQNNGLKHPKKKLKKLHEAILATNLQQADDKGFTMLAKAGETLKNKNFPYGVNTYGFPSLTAFMATFGDLYELQNDKYKCKSPDNDKK